ncbi:CYTH domain-containing protein [Aliidiomarina celeris]|uniref:CYTH domain-containing protein n=1 Tax=Aliidiomarina celeris TaxID=2249428 RepID=UPI000DE8DE7C|nr:CYTH domain-containing protein [Aliidiomarina celeris]
MATLVNAETELKYQLTAEHVEPLVAWLNAHAMAVGQKHLENLYFDTEEQELGVQKIGLRIRRWPGGAEQTVKLQGREEGALSARPEYNVPTSASVPDLTRFPAHIWPAGIDPQVITPRLQLQFEVSFQRRFWHVDTADSLLEVALDEGLIKAGGKQEAILELELELKSGNESSLLKWAENLTQHFNLQAGTKSKAQRGYALLETSLSETSLSETSLSEKEV